MPGTVYHCLGYKSVNRKDKDPCFCGGKCIAKLGGHNSMECYPTVQTTEMKTWEVICSVI